MGCPRCGRTRVEHYGVIMRCAVCGMPSNPDEAFSTQPPQQAAPPELLAVEGQPALHN